MNSRGGFILSCVIAMAAVRAIFPCRATEYEVKGKIRQTITEYNAPKLEYSSEFTVYVRDCSWLIKTVENDEKGHVWQREVGSNNGTEIYESNANQAFILGNGIPVELLDKGVDGHLWLMFASQCYWSAQTERLTPVYDWHASVGSNPNLKVAAEWELLSGPGSLPREVRYFGQWDETNGLYRVTGTNSVGGVLLPTGFLFEERYAVAHEGMVLRKRVEAEVTTVRAVCSRKNLLPVRQNAKTVIVDWRLKEPSPGNNIPSYTMLDTKKWPSLEEAKKLAEASRLPKGSGQKQPAHHRTLVLLVMCIVLVAPPVIFYARQSSRKS
jgi:hypothetical protein